MKYLAHIPTEQFGFISVELEGSAEQAVEAYREVAELTKVRPSNELETKVFNNLIDNYLSGGKIEDGANYWEQMSPAQQGVFQEIKKSFKRMKSLTT